MEPIDVAGARRVPWNKGRLTGPKPRLKLMEIWATRIRPQLAAKTGQHQTRSDHERQVEMLTRMIAYNRNLPINAGRSRERALDIFSFRPLTYNIIS